MRHHLATFASGLVSLAALGTAWAWSQAVVLTVGALCAALIAFISAVRMVAGIPLVRDLWHRLVEQPREEAFFARLDRWFDKPDGLGERMKRVEQRIAHRGD